MRTNAFFLLKMVYIKVMFRVQRRPIFSFIHSICQSVCARSSPPKYSFNGLKLMNGIQVYYGMFRLENGICKIYGSSTETHKIIKKHEVKG